MSELPDLDHEFFVRTEPLGDAVVVAVTGQADLHTAPELRTAIGLVIDSGQGALLIDLSKATFIDSMALGVLLGSFKRISSLDGSLAIVCPDPHLRRIFEITSLDRVLTLVDTREAGLVRIGGERADDSAT